MKTIVSNLTGANGKAMLIQHGDMYVLKSYETIVAVCKYDAASQKYIGYKTDWLKRMAWTQTTGKHIKLFFAQFSIEMNKNAYLKLPEINAETMPIK